MAEPTARDDERELLCGFLDWNRAVVAHKALGLDAVEAVRVATPTGLTVLGVVQHLTIVEQRWFRYHLRGEPDDGLDVATSFEVAPDVTVEDVVSAYEAACELSRAVCDGLPLDHVSAVPNRFRGSVDLRWILLHMVNETGRHLGHLDVLRELTDGRVGDG